MKEPRSDRPFHALSSAENRLWLAEQLNPGLPTYTVPILLRLSGPLDRDALHRSIQEMSNRHAGLRTHFAIDRDGRPERIVDRASLLVSSFVDLSLLDRIARQEELDRLLAAESLKRFDLRASPLFRAVTYRLDLTEHAVLLAMHHIIADGWSINILLNDLAAIYEALRAGKLPPGPGTTGDYPDYVARQARDREELHERQLAFWCERLAGSSGELHLPFDRPRAAMPGGRGTYHEFPLSAEPVERLSALACRLGTTPFTGLLATYQALLSRYTGQTDVSVGVPVAGRTEDSRDIVGLFVNTVVVRADLSDDPSFGQLLAQLGQRTRDAYAHQDVPVDQVMEALSACREASRGALFRTLINYRSFNTSALARCGLRAVAQRLPTPTAVSDLDLTLEKRDGRLFARFNYPVELFDPGTIRTFARHFAGLIDAVGGDPDTPLSRLTFVDEAEAGRLLRWSEGDQLAEEATDLIEMIADQARAAPDRAAILWDAGQISYRELDARSQALAAMLVEQGVRSETIVGLGLGRSPGLIVAVLAILRAGGAYLPLDPAYPDERLAFMIRDADVRFVVTDAGLAGRFSEHVPRTFTIETLPAQPDALIGPEQPRAPNQLAYVIYTSGSTGQPKGVLVEHRNLLNHTLWFNKKFGLGPGDRVLQRTATSFDASVWEIFSTLSSGATLVLPPDDARSDPVALARLLTSQQVTVVQCVPSFLEVLLKANVLRGVSRLRLIFCGGEPLTAPLVADLARQTGARCINLYGPTEATIDALWSEVPPSAERVTIGRPIANCRAHVLDADMRPVPTGVPGELWIGGAGVARGYLGRPALTAERFVPSPFVVGDRLYRSGDRARWRESGEIEFLGRTDGQVKLRGYRIELGEIEATLKSLPSVARAVATVREDAPGDQRLVAYVVPAAGPEPDPVSLRAALQRRLPDYMVPSAIMMIAAFPLLPNGKLDRTALPLPSSAASSSSVPTTETEKAVVALWADALGVERVGTDDNFFDLGGHSLLAVRIMSRIVAKFGTSIPLKTFILAPTVKDLAAEIDARAGVVAIDDRIMSVTEGGPLLLSSAQESLWLLHQLDPESAHYVVPEIVRLHGPIDLLALERALERLLERHEALRTRFETLDGVPLQIIDPPAPVRLPIVDLSGVPSANDRTRELDRHIAALIARPFNLAADLLVRPTLYALGPDEHVLALCIHHIVCDGWSMTLMLNELGELYRAARGEATPALPHREVRYVDYAAWQRRNANAIAAAHLSFWVERLAGAPRLELPVDKPRPRFQSHRGESFAFEIPSSEVAALRALARSRRTTLFAALLAVVQRLLARSAGQEDVVVGVPVAGRTRPETENIVGYFVNMLPLRMYVPTGEAFTSHIDRIRDALSEAFTYQDMPLDQIVRALNPPRDLSRHPLFQISVNHLLHGDAVLKWADLDVIRLPLKTRTAKFDLSIVFVEYAHEVSVRVDYATDLFESATIEGMAAEFLALLARLVQSSEIPEQTSVSTRVG